jgi:hypothetical protein
MVTPVTSVLRRRPVRPPREPALLKRDAPDDDKWHKLERVLVRALRAVE